MIKVIWNSLLPCFVICGGDSKRLGRFLGRDAHVQEGGFMHGYCSRIPDANPMGIQDGKQIEQHSKQISRQSEELQQSCNTPHPSPHGQFPCPASPQQLSARDSPPLPLQQASRQPPQSRASEQRDMNSQKRQARAQ